MLLHTFFFQVLMLFIVLNDVLHLDEDISIVFKATNGLTKKPNLQTFTMFKLAKPGRTVTISLT